MLGIFSEDAATIETQANPIISRLISSMGVQMGFITVCHSFIAWFLYEFFRMEQMLTFNMPARSLKALTRVFHELGIFVLDVTGQFVMHVSDEKLRNWLFLRPLCLV